MSRRDGRKPFSNDRILCRLSGTLSIGKQNPRLKPWAIIGRFVDIGMGARLCPAEWDQPQQLRIVRVTPHGKRPAHGLVSCDKTKNLRIKMMTQHNVVVAIYKSH